MEVTCDVRQYTGYQVVEHIVLHHNDVKAANTESDPHQVAPHKGGDAKIESGVLRTVLQDKSWNVIRMQKVC